MNAEGLSYVKNTAFFSELSFKYMHYNRFELQLELELEWK